MTGTVDTEDDSFPLPMTLEWPAPNPQGTSASIARTRTEDVLGSELGLTLTSTSPDFYFSNIQLGYMDVAGLMG